MLTLLRLSFLAAMAAVFALGLIQPAETPDLLAHQDKIGHFLAYLGLGLLGMIAWPRHRGFVLVLLLGHGAAMEFAQSLTEHRMGDPWDWLADASGVLLAWISLTLLSRARRGHHAG